MPGARLWKTFAGAATAMFAARRYRVRALDRRSLAEMAHLDRRAVMGTLSASIAHELHQPLGAILRNSEAATMLLASEQLRRDEIREIVDDIRKDVRRAAETIRRMRTLLQRNELTESAVDLNEVVRETVAFVAPSAADRGVRLEVDLADKPAIVTCDGVHLQQVLLNLILNGLDAMARTPVDERRLLVSIGRTNGHVDVAVRDSGAGIPPESLARLFDPFFTAKAEGMGMGLSIARHIVEAHRGRILAQNNDGRGATVWFSLPARARDMAAQLGARAVRYGQPRAS
jgi:signal transduction histidine kinase